MKFRTISAALAGRRPSLARVKRPPQSSYGAGNRAEHKGADPQVTGLNIREGLSALADLVAEAANASDKIAERSGRLDLSDATGREGLKVDYGVRIQFGLDEALKGRGGGGGGGGRPDDPGPRLPDGPSGGNGVLPFSVEEAPQHVLLSAPVDELDLAALDLRLAEDNTHLEVINRHNAEVLEAMELPSAVDGSSCTYVLSGDKLCLKMDKL